MLHSLFLLVILYFGCSLKPNTPLIFIGINKLFFIDLKIIIIDNINFRKKLILYSIFKSGFLIIKIVLNVLLILQNYFRIMFLGIKFIEKNF